ncbi:MAG: hypothetical protein LBU32_09280 [Clostridiales bacterium]|jgi:hypothetical protein|nr:hypothetical protein [Clostridiales bacterium]
MRRFVILFMVCALALGMTACGGESNGGSATDAPPATTSRQTDNQKRPTIKPDSGGSASWTPPSGAGMIDFGALAITDEMDSIAGGSVSAILKGLAIPISCAADRGSSGAEFYGDFGEQSDAAFAWSVISYIITHYAEDPAIVWGEDVTAPAEVVGQYFNAYFYGADEIPAIPLESDDIVKYDSAEDAYSFLIADGISANVTPSDVYVEYNDNGKATIVLAVDTQWEDEPALPLSIELAYTGNEHTIFGLSSVMAAAAGDDHGEPEDAGDLEDTGDLGDAGDLGDYLESYYNETYSYSVNIPGGFFVTAESEEGIQVSDENGAYINISGDWADIGGTQAMQNEYESASEGAESQRVDAFYEPELGFGVFSKSIEGDGLMYYYLGAANGRSLITAVLVYPQQFHDYYAQIAQTLTQDLTTMDIPESVLSSVLDVLK